MDRYKTHDLDSFIPEIFNGEYAKWDTKQIVDEKNNQHKDNLIDFASTLTHYHRLVERFGLIEDIKFCLTPDGANVLPLYENGKLIAN